MTNNTYDILKYIAQIVLPACGALYIALSNIWRFPYGEEIVGTIAAVDTFLGAVLMISSHQYYKEGKDTVGTMTVNPEDETAAFAFDDMTVEDLAAMKQVKVNVNYEGKH